MSAAEHPATAVVETSTVGAALELSNVSPGSPNVRITVVRVDKPSGAMRVGDWFEIHGSRLVIPDNKAICPYAFAAVATVIVLRQGDLANDNWFVRKPYICGPDAEENLVMKVEAIVAGEVP